MKLNQKTFKILFFLAILLMLAVRLPLITKGHMYFDDELRYRYAFQVIDGIKEGNFQEGLGNLYMGYIRPGFILLSTVPASIQRIFDKDIGKDKVKYDDLNSYNIVSLLNILTSIGICLLFYLILKLLTQDKILSLLGMIIFSLLNVNFMYIRHMTPYMLSAFMFLYLLYDIFKYGDNPIFPERKLALYGLISGFIFTVYPGHYNAIALICLLVLILEKRNKIRALLLFGLFSLFPVLIFEFISQFTQMPYLFQMEKLKAVFAGLPGGTYYLASECTPTIALYFFKEVEGVPGCILLSLFLISAALFLIRKNIPARIKTLFVLVLFLYIVPVAQNYIGDKNYMYLRYFYPMLILISLGAFLLIARLKKFRFVLLLLILGFSLISFFKYYNQYLHVQYPRDIRQFYQKYHPEEKIAYTAEFYPEGAQKACLYTAAKEGYDLLGINIRNMSQSLFDDYDFRPIKLMNKKEIFSYPLPSQAFWPYAVELGVDSLLKKNKQLKMRIYQIK